VLIAERVFIGLREIIGSQEAKDFFVHKVAIVHGKTKMCVAGLMLRTGFLEKKLIEI
jgi:hypothetical protein